MALLYIDLFWVNQEDVGLNLCFLDVIPNKAMLESEAPNLLIK